MILILIQVSYTIGVAKPLNIYLNTYNVNKTKYSDQQLEDKIEEFYDLSPRDITIKARETSNKKVS
jgi:S-adenosylmethionine synthetase